MCACHKNHSVGCIKNESNCLLENKMVSTLIWRNVILLYVVQSNILWLTFKLSYHYRCNILCTVSFLLYIATKKFKQNHYCKQFYECSYHKKNNSCTLCVPMFPKGRGWVMCSGPPPVIFGQSFTGIIIISVIVYFIERK